MNWYDIVVIAILLYGAWKGASRGLVWQLAWIAALVLCFKFAGTFAPPIAEHIKVKAPQNEYIAMFILYMGFSLVSFGGARVLKGWIEKAKFDEYDKHLGGVFGAVKGGVFALIVTFFAMALSDSLCQTVLESKSGYAAALIMKQIEPAMPASWNEYLQPHLDKLEGAIDQSLIADGDEDSNSDDQSDDGSGSFLEDFLTGSGRNRDGSGTGNESTANGGLFEDIASRVKDETTRVVLERIENSTPEERRRLLDQYGDRIDPSIRSALANLIGGPGDGQGGGNSFGLSGGELENDSSRLLDDIQNLVRTGSQERQLFADKVRSYLSDLPVAVRHSVLDDWHADLMARSDDPDPTTTVNTKLSTRILRQLDVHGVSLDRVGQGLRDELDSARLN